MFNPVEISVRSESELIEAELVHQAKGGCAESFEQLVRRYHLPLRAFLVRRTGDFSVADDLAQDVFMAAINGLGRVSQNRSFKSWLFSIARNKAIDHLRSKVRSRESTFDNIEAILAQTRLTTTESETESEDWIPALKECIGSLKPNARWLVDSYYFQNITAEKIAQLKNQRSSTVRMALLRVRKALAKCLGKKTGGGQ